MRSDYKKHAWAGGGVGLVVGLVSGYLLTGLLPLLVVLLLAWGLGTAAAYAVGWGKEYLWDASGRGQVEREDLRYTWKGGAVGALLAVFVVFLLAGVF